jgi:hypothetical protein
MICGRLFQCLLRMPRRLARSTDVYVRLTWIRLANRCGRCPITDLDGPVVSLTSYGDRIRSVHLAIESIGRGQMRPSRLILWLDDVSLVNNLPIGLRRLQSRGLEVKPCQDYGPHKKYYPYLESLQRIEKPLVTADDDILYPRYWLKRLAESLQAHPDVVNCYRAHVIVLNQDGIANYISWKSCYTTEPSFLHFATSGAGAIYPPPIQRALKREAKAFVQCCPKADDVWLNVQALRSGYRVRQISKTQFHLVEIPGTQSVALHYHNLSNGGNDNQIKDTYHASDLCRLRESG